ncbi:MAG: aldose 1-epimerase [Bacteroidales bacterium]|jgi:aldose 1-epimerase|nr:aldose 1-epimerase [Bacteroidales bacterium]MDN5328729.1 aldose 1-epimerase [Bacteroidales bacterium]NLH51437.1 galactose mutarotase [Bacteroidales bacterium]NPV36369.1 galactose mutarotase [Bacteroidales bacterium]
MKIEVLPWGVHRSADIKLVKVFASQPGLCASFTNFGATLVSLDWVTEAGDFIPLVYPLASLEQYLRADYYPGAIIGRFANRIGGAAFCIGEKNYPLSENGEGYSLHGGQEGFSHKVWDLKDFHATDQESIVVFALKSLNGDQGYPGNLHVEVTYRLTAHRLSVAYKAETDSPTHVNLTTHGYFNLSGFQTGVHQHFLRINADRYLAVDERIVATGAMPEVKDTPFDFIQGKTIGEGMSRLGEIYNHCLVLASNDMRSPAAEIFCQESGLSMKIFTTQPAFQFYTPVDQPAEQHPSLPLSKIDAGIPWSFCLEPQHLPNSPNIPHFPSTLLGPGDIYSHKTIFEVSSVL